MATHAQLTRWLNDSIQQGRPVCVAAQVGPINVGRAFCGRCSLPARFICDGESLCGGCTQTKRRDADQLCRMIAARYHTNTDVILECLADEFGMVRIRKASALQRMRQDEALVLRWHPSPGVLAEHLLARDYRTLDHQIRTYTNLLWLCALQDGQPLHGFPRDGQPAPKDCSDVAAVWAQSHPLVHFSLWKCAMRLRDERENRPHSAGGVWGPSQATVQLTWLFDNTVSPAIANHNADPMTPPKGVCLARNAA